MVHVKLDPDPRRGHSSPAATPRMPLPGLVGSDPVWLRACRQVEAASRSGEWLVVSGEPGVGKLALVQAVQLRRQPIRHLEVLDARGRRLHPRLVAVAPGRPGRSSPQRRASGTSTPSTGSCFRELVSALGSARRSTDGSPPWVAVTVGRVNEGPDTAPLLRLFPRTVEVRPCASTWATWPPWCRSSSASSAPAAT